MPYPCRFRNDIESSRPFVPKNDTLNIKSKI